MLVLGTLCLLAARQLPELSGESGESFFREKMVVTTMVLIHRMSL